MLIPLFLLAGACGTGGGRQKTGKDGHRTELKSFPYPEIPSMVTDPGERRTYLLEHFWNGFDFRDTVLLKRREITERGFADFITRHVFHQQHSPVFFIWKNYTLICPR